MSYSSLSLILYSSFTYSQGFYTNPECRYVEQNSGQTKYSFTVSLDSCGTQFINDFAGEAGQAYLENVLVLQVKFHFKLCTISIKSESLNFLSSLCLERTRNTRGLGYSAKSSLSVGREHQQSLDGEFLSGYVESGNSDVQR